MVGWLAGRAGAEVLLGRGSLHGLAMHAPVSAIWSHCSPCLVTYSWLHLLKRRCRHGELGAKVTAQILFISILIQFKNNQLLNMSRPPVMQPWGGHCQRI